MSGNSMTEPRASAHVAGVEGGKFLTFHLAQETYGLEILKIQEIIQLMHVTRVPRTPPFVRGVVNLRGKVIPVVDLRLKFAMASQDDTERTCIIVVQVRRDARIVTMGVIVDEVSEVLDIQSDQIEPAPEFDSGLSTEFILGMGKVAQKVVMLLDADKVLSGGELQAMASLEVEA